MQNVHVLIVDDEPLARVALANLLSSGGDVLHFDLAADAIEALSRLKTASYDLVLLDINMAEQRQPERIAIKTNGRILFIKPEEVLSVHAEGNYVLLQGEAGTHLLRESISTMAKKLEPYGFIRIHRSVLVNSCYVVEIQPHTTGDYCLRIRGGKEFRVTRSYKTNLKSLATSWIGTDGFFRGLTGAISHR